ALALCFLLLFSLWGGCNNNQVEPEEIEEVPVVEVEEIDMGDIREDVTITGELSAHLEIQVMPEIAEEVEEVAVKAGDMVSKGDLLVRLSARDQELQLQEAQAALRGAQAQLAELKAGTRDQEIEQLRQSLRQAQAQLAEAKAGPREQELEQLRETLAKAERSRNQAQKELERVEQLYQEGYVSSQELEQAQLQVDVAESDYKSAQAALSQAEEGPRRETIETLEAQVEQARAALSLAQEGPRRETVEAAEAQAEQARVALERAQDYYDKTRIQAPVSGRVAMVGLEVGERASPEQPAALVVDIETLYFEGALPEGAVGRVETGITGEVYVPAVGRDPFAGVIEEIDLVAPQGARSYPVKISVENPEGLLRGGMYARAEIPVEEREQVPLVPLGALIEIDGEEKVYVVEDGQALLREPLLGLRGEEYVEVLEGLSPQDLVIVRGQEHLTDGMEVEVLEGDL
ncbi:MAG: efflux RND transporter periplasmic adaptor subunit, partial [Candidatus Syntrophonatronum acetioxidans]